MFEPPLDLNGARILFVNARDPRNWIESARANRKIILERRMGFRGGGRAKRGRALTFAQQTCLGQPHLSPSIFRRWQSDRLRNDGDHGVYVG